MLTFVHLSDIHFLNRDDRTQFDLDQPIRRALIEDLKSSPHGTSSFSGLLVTGDIAFGGAKEEYKRAAEFFDEVFEATGIQPKRTYVIPGNHDVDRQYTQPDLPLFHTHHAIRAATTDVEWRDILHRQLHKDPVKLLLRPFENYNDFAQGYDCVTTPEQLAWTNRLFDEPISSGLSLRLHGLNSAIVSNAQDGVGGLFVSDYQTTHLQRSPGVVDMLLCHHPPDWLRDKQQLRNNIDSFVTIGLFGHEHQTRVVATKKHVALFAGAVQPSRRDPGWLPTYHIIQLATEGADGDRRLSVRIWTREFLADRGHRFHPRLTDDDQPSEAHMFSLEARGASVKPMQEDSTRAMTDEASKPDDGPSPPTQREIAQRELLVQFFRLATPARYSAAIETGLLREGDDTLDPREMWAEVFDRAVAEDRLGQFWEAVSKRNSSMQKSTNPFRGA